VENPFRIIGLSGKAGAGKDTFYEHVLKPRGFLRWQMTLHYKVWFTATNMAKTSRLFAAFGDWRGLPYGATPVQA
jgi:dephospho-CoA kinase